MRISDIFSSFSHKNYRYYFTGQGFSLIGTWMQSTAMGWLVYRISGSSAKLGAVGFATMMPALLFGYVAGIYADRIERKKGLYLTQFLSMLCALAVFWLSFTGKIKISHIMFIGFISGVAGAFDMPLRQSFVIEMVGRDSLSNALALNSIMFNASRMIGPALAGFIIKYSSETLCFFINFASYIFIMAALAYIRPYKIERKRAETDVFSDLKSGIDYIWNTEYIRYPLSFLMLLSFVIMPVITLLPVYVKHLGGDSRILGAFMSMIGFGAIVSGLQMAGKKENRSMVLTISRYSLLYGMAVLLLSFSRNIFLSAGFLFLAGVGTARQTVGINTLIQTLVREEMRGRVVSIYALSFMGLAPFGNVFWGGLAEKIGIPNVIFFAALWIIAVNIWFIAKMSEFKKLLLVEKEKYNFDEYQNLKNLI